MSQANYQTMPDRDGDSTAIYVGNPPFNGFDVKSIRANFTSKVYSILSVQLIATCAVIALFLLYEPIQGYLKGSTGLIWMYSAFGLGMIAYLVLVCVESSRRNYPLNFVLLTVFTIGFGLVAAIAASYYDVPTVLYAAGATAFATVAVALLAKYAPFDITTCGCALLVLTLLHLLASIIILLAVPSIQTSNLIIAGSGSLLISLYLLYDLQLIMGGRTLELSPEEYILGAILLYIDIVNIFQYMLILFGSRR